MKNINQLFDEKLEELRNSLPILKEGINCSELTLISVLDILGINSYLFHNLAIPLAAGFGGYTSKKGWKGACGAVCGGCAAIGIIMGGHERMNNDLMIPVALRAANFAEEFEKEFGSVVCSELCGYDFGKYEALMEYRKNGIWAKKCYHFVIWAVDEIRRLTQEELKKNWD
ncbi:MAG: C-GCAxxG-C-C family protein [Candidatus Thorarchaeota archaeon]